MSDIYFLVADLLFTRRSGVRCLTDRGQHPSVANSQLY